ncbi:MAG: pseudouridine synthase, partial [Chloroflexota bacterium]|nr:pseudouridine synthase [Chloroflexota bacterium]
MERLQRVMAARGSGSRRDAEALIVQGRVTVDGQRVTELGTRVDPVQAVIRVDGKEIRAQRDRTIILHKPAGYITTVRDERDRWTVMDLVDVRERVYPVGRLDRDTEGLLVLTNNGELANRIMHPRFRLTKEYHVLTTIRPDDRTMQRVRDGVLVDGQIIQPDEFRLLRQTREGIWLTISLHVGMYHVIRRMMEAVKIPVERLTRVRVGPLGLEGIQKGTWRELTPGEAASLAEAVHLDEPAPPVSRPSRPRRGPDAFARPDGRRTPVPVAQNRPAPERTFGLRPKPRVPATAAGEPMQLVGDGGRDDPRREPPFAAAGPGRGDRPGATRRPDRGRDDGDPRGRGRGEDVRPARDEREGGHPRWAAGPAARRDGGLGRSSPDQVTSGRRSRGMAPDRGGRGVEPGVTGPREDTRGPRGRDAGAGPAREERPPKGHPTGGRRAGRMVRPDRM